MSGEHKERYPYGPIPATIWEQSGITTHPGGIEATRRLLGRCPLQPGQRVLDLGCGTGYTAVLLAQQHQSKVAALDISRRCLLEAQARGRRSGLTLPLTRGDAHSLPYASASFNGVLIESVLLFCDVPCVLSECYRVLKPGGWLALNELTLRGPAPPELLAMIAQIGLGSVLEAKEWETSLLAAGLADIVSAVFPYRLREQFKSHCQVEGLCRYLLAAIRTLRKTAVRRTFLNQKMMQAARHFRYLIGYGLYLGWKPHASIVD